MKLSKLEALVAAMRSTANTMGVVDPNVEFFDAETSLMEKPTGKNTAELVCSNLEPVSNCVEHIDYYVSKSSGSACCRGDFAIPLKYC